MPAAQDGGNRSQGTGESRTINSTGESATPRSRRSHQHLQHKRPARGLAKKEETTDVAAVETRTVTTTQTVTLTGLATNATSTSSGRGVWVATPSIPSTTAPSSSDSPVGCEPFEPLSTSTGPSTMQSSSVTPAAGPATSDAAGNDQGFVRTGYYNAEQQTLQNMTFLGNYGGQGSGKWTP